MPDAGCAVKWGADIFMGMLDQPTLANCTGSGTGLSSCHGDSKGGLTLTPGDAHGAYMALKNWMIMSAPGVGKQYIVPCDPMNSGVLCNLAVDDPDGGAATNTYGTCGSTMPLVGVNLTTDQQAKIAEWISCGAPEN